MTTEHIEENTSQVLSITRQLTALMIGKDIIQLNKILDTYFTLTHITGYVQPKMEWLSEIENERMKYYEYREMTTAITKDGYKTAFVGQNHLDDRIWAREIIGVYNRRCNLKKGTGNG